MGPGSSLYLNGRDRRAQMGTLCCVLIGVTVAVRLAGYCVGVAERKHKSHRQRVELGVK